LESSAKIAREIDGGLQTVEVKLPAVMTTDLAAERAALLPRSQYHEKPKKKRRSKKDRPPIMAWTSRPG